jgi:hypothetical protein
MPIAVQQIQELQGHPQRCGNPSRRDVATPAAVQLPIPRQPNPRAGVRATIRQELQHYHLRSHPGQAQELPRRLPGTRFARTAIESQALCATPLHYT